jgi:hypothetical protein
VTRAGLISVVNRLKGNGVSLASALRRLARLRVRTDQSGVAERIVRAAGTFG